MLAESQTHSLSTFRLQWLNFFGRMSSKITEIIEINFEQNQYLKLNTLFCKSRFLYSFVACPNVHHNH